MDTKSPKEKAIVKLMNYSHLNKIQCFSYLKWILLIIQFRNIQLLKRDNMNSHTLNQVAKKYNS